MRPVMLDLELPFNPDSNTRLVAAERRPEPEVVAFTHLGCWGLAHLSSTLSIDGHPRLVGRELESVRLLHAVDAVARERAAVVATIAGVPGSGKTRLIEDTLNVAQAAGFEGRVFSVTAEPGDQKNATIARLLRARFGLNEKSASFKRHCLLRRVAELFGDERVEDVCYFLGDLVGAKFEPTPLTRALSQQPFQAEQALQTVICELFAADSRRAPLCLVIEDLQHVDRDSLGTLMALVDELGPGNLLIFSGVPEFFSRHEHFADANVANHEHIELPPLEGGDVRMMLRQVVGPCLQDGEALQAYVVDAGLGNPGLILELVRELWAFGALQRAPEDDGCIFFPGRLPELASRPRLNVAADVRRASLPGLHVALLEAGAVVGSVCWESLWPTLLSVHSPELAELDTALVSAAVTELEREGHLLRLPDSSIEGEVELLFRDPADRERLASQMAPSKRRSLSRAIADWLLQRETTLAGSSELLLLLARHLAQAGSGYRAALSYLKAAAIARDEDGCLKACHCLERGLAELGEQDNRRRLDALHDYGATLAELGRPAQARQVFGEMAKLACRLGLPGKQGAALNRVGRAHRESGELALAQLALEQALRLFQQARDLRGIASTQDDLGKVLWLMGDRFRAVQLMRAALEARKQTGDERSLAVSLSNLALVWDEQGRASTSERALGIVGEICRRSTDARAQCDALLVNGNVATHRHELERARAAFRQATQLAYAAKDRPRLARSLIQLGVAELRCGDLLRAEELLGRGSQLAQETESWLDLAEAKRALAKLMLKCGRMTRARVEASAAMRLARRTGCQVQLAATLRTFADVVSATRRPAAEQRVVGYYMRSIELSKRLGDEHQLAKGYRAFADFADRYESTEIRRQSELLRKMSDEIFERRELPHAACA